MRFIANCLIVGLAGFAGAVSRYLVATLCGRLIQSSFPVGTFLINITGSFVLGWFITVIGQRVIAPENLRLAVAVGFLGAYTTFSTYVFESDQLIAKGAHLQAAVNIAGSVLAGLLAVRLGVVLGRR